MSTQSHDERIARIAEELSAPLAAVKRTYLDTLRDLSLDALFHDFLHVFVEKRVINALRERPRE